MTPSLNPEPTLKRRANVLVATVAMIICFVCPPAHADYTVRPDPSDNRGTWEGFGASLSWWANAVGGTPYEATYNNLFFSLGSVSFMGGMVPGLGLNIARYNIGGGGLPSDNVGGVKDQRPSASVLPWYKDIDGYWRDWYSTDPTSASWDWTRDARQRSVLSNLRTRGVTVEFFANAPIWWMMDTRSSAGGNLQAWNRRDHARYLATVVQQARTKWGVDVKSIEPFNEPAAGWWIYPVGQEGANILFDAQAETLGYLREELNARGLTDVTIAASDENTITQAQAGYQSLLNRNVAVSGKAVSAASLVGKVNVHGYNGLDPWRDDVARRSLRGTVGDKRLWMSEYGDSDGSGLWLAQSIMADLNQLKATAWVYWQPLEPYSAWGLVNGSYGAPADETAATRGQPSWTYTKYHVFAQFTRFLRPGYQIIGSTDSNTVVGYDATNRKLVLITLNEGAAQTISYDLSRFPFLGTPTASVTTTTFDGTSRLSSSTATLVGKTLSLRVPAKSVQSIEVWSAYPGVPAQEIRSAATGQCVDVFAASTQPASNLVQYDCVGVDHQRWLATSSNGGYTLRASHTNQCMNVSGGSTAAGAALIQWPCSGVPNELFDLRPQGLGYAFVARHSGLCVGLENGSAARDTRLIQQACTGAATQTWMMPLPGSSTLQSTGNYLCLDMAGGTKQVGTEATQWQCAGSTNQHWMATPAGTDVQLSSVTSGLCLGVAASSLAAGAPLVQWTCQNVADQRFQRIPQGGGFALMARHSGMCLAPEGGSQVWGARIVQQPCNGSANQTWR